MIRKSEPVTANDQKAFLGPDAVIGGIRLMKNEISEAISAEDVDVYLFIQEQFHASNDLSRATIFQFAYRNFYGLGVRTKSFLKAYFELFEQQRGNPDPDLKVIVSQLQAAVGTFEFSFATKMAATIDNSLPVYDRHVRTVFNFKDEAGGGDINRAELFRFYEHLVETTNVLVIQRNATLMDIDTSVGARIKGWREVSSEKKIDFILWTAGRLMNK